MMGSDSGRAGQSHRQRAFKVSSSTQKEDYNGRLSKGTTKERNAMSTPLQPTESNYWLIRLPELFPSATWLTQKQEPGVVNLQACFSLETH